MNIIKVETYRYEQCHIYSVCDASGESVVDKIADQIDHGQIKQAEKLLTTIENAAMLKPTALPQDRCHSIKDKIWQFRADSIRVLWFYDKGNIIVCAHSFIKKTRKTPSSEIKAAKTIMDKYFIAKNNGDLTIIQEETDG